eukprot:TRINITY_DN425_c0_g1_i2.p2 TRINITY_DN425_c0_g1~~TRINITY_DN425_c0_g1_i2.p2  ORF type:complete len:250 (+),score=40.85 TRINITY_DN425_c0_g1_i2:76-750(+)
MAALTASSHLLASSLPANALDIRELIGSSASNVHEIVCASLSRREVCGVKLHSAGGKSRSQRSSTAASFAATASASLAAIDTYPSLSDLDDGDDEYYEVPVYSVKIHDRLRGVEYNVEVPQDQYILHTAEEEGIRLPFACRHGCCTACAVRVISGELAQPHALGISPELKEKGYALLCVGYPLSDLEVETQDEDEVYWLQFGRYFARGPVERDDYALELAMADE